MKVSATEAKNRFGSLSAQAKREPVIVEKAGKPDTVILSYEEYQRLKNVRPPDLELRKKWFGETYKEWIEAQNRLIDQYGVFGEEFRPW
jgi:prevent-host-death family protein